MGLTCYNEKNFLLTGTGVSDNKWVLCLYRKDVMSAWRGYDAKPEK